MGLTKPRAGQINFDATNITDPLIRINSGQSGANDKDAGWVVERGSDANVALIWDESADEFVLANTTENGTTSGNVTISSYAGLHVGSFIANGLTYPTSDGTNGQVLQTDGQGALSFADGGSGSSTLAELTDTTITSAASGEIIQYNGSSWVNDDTLVVDTANTRIGINNTSPTKTLEVNGTIKSYQLESEIYSNETQIDNSYTIPAGSNSLSVGPVTVADGITVTISDGSVWHIL